MFQSRPIDVIVHMVLSYDKKNDKKVRQEAHWCPQAFGANPGGSVRASVEVL